MTRTPTLNLHAPSPCSQSTPAGPVSCTPPAMQALAQCDTFIRNLGATKGAVDDTATGAQMVASQRLTNVGAICSSRAAELYGLEILENGIQDVKDNVTRFVVLGRYGVNVVELDRCMGWRCPNLMGAAGEPEWAGTSDEQE